MHLVQLLLPLYDNDGFALPQDSFQAVSQELTRRFGGLTAYTRAPAEGWWKQEGDPTSRDEIVILEVMVRELDEAWWHNYRRDSEHRFRQESIVIRAQPVQLL
ncbi:hypothetical protein [Aurantimonas endophytica]|uniref:DUF1330 domain-containing protein n=1 Tax=Aurantimonas endophytica TaxID=1522175 RepID=A0A7W6MPR4_9HYPH|nr:hypothetical protein [Aurantimonas endophytica]MBB4003213.1 hypothetical protein [Aurantimonas endophytica]MCO6404077.1 hypothetical protein [Aurantimonas endophytica]